MKQRKISKTNVVNFSTYLGMVVFFIVMTALSKAGVLNRSMTGLLVPICCYMSMAVSLNLTVGILGELSLGHAGFMSVGAFAGVIASQSLLDVVPSAGLRLTIAMIVGALFATVAGFIVGAPVLRLQGDYLAIVTLAVPCAPLMMAMPVSLRPRSSTVLLPVRLKRIWRPFSSWPTMRQVTSSLMISPKARVTMAR